MSSALTTQGHDQGGLETPVPSYCDTAGAQTRTNGSSESAYTPPPPLRIHFSVTKSINVRQSSDHTLIALSSRFLAKLSTTKLQASTHSCSISGATGPGQLSSDIVRLNVC